MIEDIFSGIIGLCIGDIIGLPVEFKDRRILKKYPIKDMIEYGTHNQPKGTWSDDTSMSLCLADSIGDTGCIDFYDIMNKFVLWIKKGKYTSNDRAFDIGNSCRNALIKYLNGINPLECGESKEYDNGNGCIMRILPLSFYIYKKYGYDFLRNKNAIQDIHNVCSLTHNHPRSKIACVIYISILINLIKDKCLIESICVKLNNSISVL